MERCCCGGQGLRALPGSEVPRSRARGRGAAGGVGKARAEGRWGCGARCRFGEVLMRRPKPPSVHRRPGAALRRTPPAPLLWLQGAGQVVVRVSARRMAQKCTAARPRAASGAMYAFAVYRECAALWLNLLAWTTARGKANPYVTSADFMCLREQHGRAALQLHPRLLHARRTLQSHPPPLHIRAVLQPHPPPLHARAAALRIAIKEGRSATLPA